MVIIECRLCQLDIQNIYHFYPKCSDRPACANSVDPDQTPQNAASDQDLHYLLHVTQCLRYTKL